MSLVTPSNYNWSHTSVRFLLRFWVLFILLVITVNNGRPDWTALVIKSLFFFTPVAATTTGQAYHRQRSPLQRFLMLVGIQL